MGTFKETINANQLKRVWNRILNIRVQYTLVTMVTLIVTNTVSDTRSYFELKFISVTKNINACLSIANGNFYVFVGNMSGRIKFNSQLDQKL